MSPTTAFRDSLFKEIVGHIKEDDDTAPYRRGDYFYFTRTVKGLQYQIYLRKKGSLTAPEEVIVDLNELAKHQSFMALGAFAPSDDGRLLAYSTDATGYRQYTLHVKDLSTGMLLPDTAEHVGGIVWTTDNRTLFFTTEDAVTKRSDKFFRHELGSPRTDLVYEEKDELFDIAVRRSRRHLSRERLQDLHGVRVSPANKPTAPLEFDQKSTNLSCPSTSSRTGNRCCSRVLRA
jgi:oligopeptidase B